MKNYEPKINKLLDVVIEIARGNYDVRFEVSQENDMLDALGVGLNMMIDDVKNGVSDLQKEKEWFSVTFNSIGDALIATDAECNITMMNPPAERLTGWKNIEASGVKLENVLKFRDKKTEKDSAVVSVCDIIKNKPFVTQSWNAILVSKDSTEIPVENSVAPIEDAKGSLIGAIMIFRDISEKLRKDKEKEILNAQLFHASKLASIGTLVASIAHEINNPLAIVKGSIDFVEKACHTDCGLCGQKAECKKISRFEKISKASDRIANIVEGLRNYARTDEIKIEAVNIHKIILDIFNLYETIFSKSNIEFKVDLAAKNYCIRANAGKCQQVIINLLNNAQDAVKEKGLVSIHTYNENGKIFIEISDNGTGIDKESLSRLFTPFYTTKQPGKGVGLGLVISKSIINSFEGDISVESEKDIGTKLSISIPVTAESCDVYVPETEGTQEIINGSVLVVDDEIDIAELLKEYLTPYGLDVDIETESTKVIGRIERKHYNYIITDMKMPLLSGDKLIMELQRKNFSDIKIVLVTGAITTDLSEQQREVIMKGTCAYLKKPFDEKAIKNMLKCLILSTGNGNSLLQGF